MNPTTINKIENNTVSIIDYNEFRNLEEKLNRVRLKHDLYENRRDNDYNRVQELSGNIHGAIEERDILKKTILKL